MATTELSRQLVTLEQTLEAADEQLVSTLLDDFFSKAEMTADRIEGFVSLTAECDARLGFRLAKIERMNLRAEKDKTTLAAMKLKIADYLRSRETRYLQAGEHKLSLAPCGAAPILVDADLLPRRFFTETVSAKPDLSAIRKALASGEVVPGATLGERKEALRIA